ncbi:phosphoprotein phosphatase (serine/threonine specific protein phosphatase) [Rhynchosporium secalis]|uniref:Serine/threonine-protein phosphatase n=1 Tax=Rhynchosporium secalis TaxID=38038 RepID=A0A1E1MAW2_RHYSE|nr:phosphoprotein phosphatase (serine/threonine specific protein phosphatase) [Rhynchosporium secalis]
MISSEEQALAFKNDGNTAFAAHDWPTAIDFYTKAIELDDQKPTYFSNRAQANIKSEAYGYAIVDATKAIELDPNFVKDALKDFRTVVKKAPNDKDAKLKLAECEKIVKKVAFLQAIDPGEEPSAAEGLDLDSMAVDADYDGVRLEQEMTSDFIDDMLVRFKNGKKIHKKYVYQIILAVKKIVYDEATMVEMEIEDDANLTVCGDTHGQFFDLMELFRLNGFPTEKHYYLFNGDFVDRGSWSTEIALLLYAYKWLRPSAFFINRGNHETDDMNRAYGFEGECKAKYNERTFKLFSESFSALPLATLIGKKYLVLHGGLFSDDKVTLNDIRKLNRHNQRQPGQAGLMMEMLWTDPQTEPGRGPSKRGVGMQFGPDVTKRFCENNGLEAIIRSHEVRMEGYEEEHDGRCITVFSAPRYCDSTENKGAYINIGPDYKLEFHKFDAVPHPNIKPMAYQSGSLMSMT